LVVKLPIMGGLTFYCHERLTNTKGGKRNGRKWKKMGGMMLQMSEIFFPSCLSFVFR